MAREQKIRYSGSPVVGDDVNRRGRSMLALGVIFGILGMILSAVAVYALYYVWTHEQRTYVLIEVDMVRGVARTLDQFDGHLPKEMRERLLESRLVQLVENLESFDRNTVNHRLTKASFFVTTDVSKRFEEMARKRNDEYGMKDTVKVNVHNVTHVGDHTGYDKTEKRFESVIDYELIEYRGLVETKTLHTATVRYHFPGYKPNETTSRDSETMRQIRLNPEGMMLEWYDSSQSTLPPAQPSVVVKEKRQ